MARHAVALIRLLRDEGDAGHGVAARTSSSPRSWVFPFWRGLALLVLGAERARRAMRRASSSSTSASRLLIEDGNRGGASFGLAMLADAQVHLGRYEQAVATADAGLATSVELGQPFYDPELLRLKAVALVHGRPERTTEALALLEESLTLARRLGAASWALRTYYDPRPVARSHGGARADGDVRCCLAP